MLIGGKYVGLFQPFVAEVHSDFLGIKAGTELIQTEAYHDAFIGLNPNNETLVADCCLQMRT